MSIYVIHTKNYEEWKSAGYMYLVESDSPITATQEFIKNFFYEDRDEEELEEINETLKECVTLEEYEDWIYDSFQSSFRIMDTSPKVTELFTGHKKYSLV